MAEDPTEEEIRERYGEEAAEQYREAMKEARGRKDRGEIITVGGVEYTPEAYEEAGRPTTREEVERGHERVAALIEKKEDLRQRGIDLGRPQYARERDELTYLGRGILPASGKYPTPLEWYPVIDPVTGEDITLKEMLRIGIGQERYLEARGKVEYLPEATFKFTTPESVFKKSHAQIDRALYDGIEITHEGLAHPSIDFPKTTAELRERLSVFEQELNQTPRFFDFILPPLAELERVVAGPTGITMFPMRREVAKGFVDLLRTPVGIEEIGRGALARGAAIREVAIKHPEVALAIAAGGFIGFGKMQLEALKESPVRFAAGVVFTSLAIEGIGRGISRVVRAPTLKGMMLDTQARLQLQTVKSEAIVDVRPVIDVRPYSPVVPSYYKSSFVSKILSKEPMVYVAPSRLVPLSYALKYGMEIEVAVQVSKAVAAIPILAPSLKAKQISLQVPRQVVPQISKQVDVAMALPLQISKQAAVQLQKAVAVQVPIQVQKAVAIQKTISVQVQMPRAITTRVMYEALRPPTRPPGFGIGLPKDIAERKGRLTIKPLIPKQEKGYRPSLIAIGFKITAPRAPKVVIGPEIRPIIKIRSRK